MDEIRTLEEAIAVAKECHGHFYVVYTPEEGYDIIDPELYRFHGGDDDVQVLGVVHPYLGWHPYQSRNTPA